MNRRKLSEVIKCADRFTRAYNKFLSLEEEKPEPGAGWKESVWATRPGVVKADGTLYDGTLRQRIAKCLKLKDTGQGMHYKEIATEIERDGNSVKRMIADMRLKGHVERKIYGKVSLSIDGSRFYGHRSY